MIDHDGLYENGILSSGIGWQIPRLPGLGHVDWDRFSALYARRLRRPRSSSSTRIVGSRPPTSWSSGASYWPGTYSARTSTDSLAGDESKISPVSLLDNISFTRPSGRISRLTIEWPSWVPAFFSIRPVVPTSPLDVDRLPLSRSRRAVGRVHDRVDDVAVIEGLPRLATLVHRVEHVGEHVDVAELADLVADREEPPARWSRPSRRRSRRRSPEVYISKPVRRKWLSQIVPSVPATSSRRSMPPRKVQQTSNWPMAPYSNRISATALSSASIGWTSVSLQHMTSTGRFPLPDEVADDLDAVTPEVDDRAAAGLLLVPEPGAVRAGMGLARARPGHVADLRRLRPSRRPSASSACSTGPRGSRRTRRRARPCPGCAGPPRRCGRAASCRARPCRPRAQLTASSCR